jgi:ATP-binding cassette subfamily F protein 3
MLNFSDLSLRRGARLLFEQVTFTIHSGQMVGLTGANGCGKSSLFALLRGELQADGGDVSLPPNLVIAHVAQETPAVEASAIDYVMDGDTELRRLQQQLAVAEQSDNGQQQAELHAQLDTIGGYTARSRAARLMHGLGFRTEQEEQPVSAFSGGWRMRLNLAQALMCRSDLLLLDEPTNHLDLDAVIWLQEWLKQYSGTLMLISHDRDFLDEITDHIAHVEQQGITLYTGNYSDFERMRAERLANQQSAYEKQQREIRHVQSFVDRFRAKATKARQAQSRLKALERMERIAPAHIDSPFHFGFRKPEKLPTPLLGLDQVAAGYAGKPIIEAVNLTLQPGDRVGLLGHNGAGKSTLIKLIAGELTPLNGEMTPAQDLRIGYFAQHQLEQLDPQATPIQHLQRLDPKASEQSLRDYIGGFGFNNDMALSPVAPFSGGEKARLVLALLVYQRPNLLLLDEPTNHLDLEMRHALSLALQEYEGALVVVSHDRHLLRSVTDTLLLVDSGRVSEFDGDLEDYRRWLGEQQREETANDSTAGENSAVARKERRRQEAELRRQLQPLRKALQTEEKKLDTLQEKKSRLEQQLADPELYADSQKDALKTLLQEKGLLDQALAETEERWLSLSEELEQASAEMA